MLSTGHHSNQSVVRPAAAQGLESSRPLVRLGPLARMGADCLLGRHAVARSLLE